MLIRLVLENIAIIDSLALEFQEGLNVLTGESGSGKSIILEGIQRVFDKRSSPKDLLKHGAQRGRIELTFVLEKLHNRSLIEALLATTGVELLSDDQDLVVSREITAATSRSRVNGCPVPSETMEKLGQLILEIYGQHDLHTLFSSARQRDLLDNMGGEPILKVCDEVRRAYQQVREIKARLESLQMSSQERERQIDFLNYQIREITEANLSDPKEDEHLKLERDRLSHLETLRELVAQVTYLLTDSDQVDSPSVQNLFNRVQKSLSAGSALDPQFSNWHDRMDGLSEDLSIITRELSHYADHLNMTPERMQEIVDRLDSLEKLKRKYGGTIESIIQSVSEMAITLESFEQSEGNMTELETQLEKAEAHFLKLTGTLSDLRERLAASLETRIEEELHSLMLPVARFQIQLVAIPPSENGQEQVVFLFSANPGEPLKPLSQVASGGELSRLMLALKIQTAHADGLTTLILDEIDTGMSGLALRTVAEKLQTLQQQCQILVITHQPILAALAPWHIHVEKYLEVDTVRVKAQPLFDIKMRKSVLAQLASGFSQEDPATTLFIEQLLDPL
jgi:DNA repair protein RecN (Recombination protein N)